MPGPASFLAATLFEPTGPGRYRGRFDASWYQGRGAFGGVVGGATLRAMAHTVAAPALAVRSLTVHFCAPAVEGEAEVQVRVERVGRRVTHVTARTEAAGGYAEDFQELWTESGVLPAQCRQLIAVLG